MAKLTRRLLAGGLIVSGYLFLPTIGILVPQDAAAAIIPECRSVPGTESECLQTCTDSCLAKGLSSPSAEFTNCFNSCDLNSKCKLEVCSVDSIIQLVVNIYNYLLGFSAIVALLFIVWGGIRMIWHGAMESPDQELTSAKQTITRALVGLVIIFAAYALVNTLLVLLGVPATSDVGKLLVEWGLIK